MLTFSHSYLRTYSEYLLTDLLTYLRQVQAELEESLRYLLTKRKDDPYREVLPRLAVEASWGWERQVPTFRP